MAAATSPLESRAAALEWFVRSAVKMMPGEPIDRRIERIDREARRRRLSNSRHEVATMVRRISQEG